MSIHQSQPLISSSELQICIKVLSKFNHTGEYSPSESNEFSRIRRLILNLNRMRKRFNRRKNQNDCHALKTIDFKAKCSRSLRFSQKGKSHSTDALIPKSVVQSQETETTNDPQLLEMKSCYLCKIKYHALHCFYDRLCPSCAKLNYEKRLQTTDLTNHVALVTGGRIKIGYRIVLKLLRANCFVIATSRFPMDFLNRLNKEYDFEQWKNRVHIYGVEFRYSKLVESFTNMLIEKYDRLDFIINNACQTIRKSPEFYQHLFPHEKLTNYSSLPDDQLKILEGNLHFYESLIPFSNHVQYTCSSSSSNLSCIPTSNQSDDMIQPTSSITNEQRLSSSSSCLDELPAIEMNETIAVNTLAPFILNSKLKVLMTHKHPDPDSIKFIINVSNADSLFSDVNKSDFHPHTNAAKAALNMMTRTSGRDYKKSNIYMISVDTGS